MVATASLLIALVTLIDAIPLPPPGSRHRGRPLVHACPKREEVH